MPDPTTDDDERRWRRFTRMLLGSACALCTLLYAFVVLVDPHDHLALSLPLEPQASTSAQPVAASHRRGVGVGSGAERASERVMMERRGW